MGIPIGTKYGDLITIELPKNNNRAYGVLCRCKCGIEKVFQPSVLKSGRTKKCRECSRKPLPEEYGDFINLKHQTQEGGKLMVEMECKNCHYIKISKKSSINGQCHIYCPICQEETSDKGICITLFKKIKANALKRNIEFSLTSKYLNDLYVIQNKKCALTGVDIFLTPKNIRISHDINTASLDRTNSSLGYVEGNVRWVHKVINQFISDFSDDEVFYLCNLILQNNKIVNNTLEIDKINKSKQRNNENTTNKKREGSPKKKPVFQYSLDGELIKEYPSINQAARELGYPSPSGIIGCCKGKQKSTCGFTWKYKEK
jgi:hypothetical protein